ncbi:Coiled-coil domain-containing protein 37 [Dufourea novaeangliae]|uniref:Coiled-coil domain-containing protein 37 n=1 Tax=Dufourea novaeangliae TaxID=178035 RepID=A0A154P3C5_DUFNO|nr:Coiled-coil domain-containing protein 37 [Dufourea novaeangliae]
MGEAIDVNKEQSPFVHPPCSLMFSYFQYWKARKRSAAMERRKGVARDTHRNNLLRTLRVDVNLEVLDAKKHKDLDEAMAITDVDPGFFKAFSNRVVKEKFSVQEYVDDLREIFKTRLLAGQETDDCIRIEQQFVEEQKRLDKIKARYNRYVSGFEDFLSKDHEASMDILVRAEKESKLTRELTNTRNQLFREFGQVRLDVYLWEENWRTVKMCQRFLYQVAPVSWRQEHDWIHRSDSGETIISASTDNLFGRYRMADEVASLDTLIELFEEDIESARPTEIYFEDPSDLIRVFRAIETQNLNALIHVESLAEPMSHMMMTIESAEEQIKTEVEEIKNAIHDLQIAIYKLESRAEDLKSHANKLLGGAFREAVCAEEVLRFQVFIEDTFESCIGPNDANLDSFSMMKWIEKTHEDLNLELDTLRPEVVKACEKEGFRQELRAMRETEAAARKEDTLISARGDFTLKIRISVKSEDCPMLRVRYKLAEFEGNWNFRGIEFELMHRLLASLKRVMEPPVIKHRPLTRRSEPATQRVKPTPPPPVPTEEEWQYLTFFTNYCKQEDFTAYRTEFPDDFDLTFQPKQLQEADQESGDSAESSVKDDATES